MERVLSSSIPLVESRHRVYVVGSQEVARLRFGFLALNVIVIRSVETVYFDQSALNDRI